MIDLPLPLPLPSHDREQARLVVEGLGRARAGPALVAFLTPRTK